jgi:serine/threonine protein phosphatase PrpC
VVCESGKAVDLSIDHKPDMPEEKARIEKAGGFVEENRVKGSLNLSRSIGDFEYKNDPKLPIEEQMVTVVPEIKTISRVPGHSFLIIACDGIWDCKESQEAVDFAKEQMRIVSGNHSKIIGNLFDSIVATDVTSSRKLLPFINALRGNWNR